MSVSFDQSSGSGVRSGAEDEELPAVVSRDTSDDARGHASSINDTENEFARVLSRRRQKVDAEGDHWTKAAVVGGGPADGKDADSTPPNTTDRRSDNWARPSLFKAKAEAESREMKGGVESLRKAVDSAKADLCDVTQSLKEVENRVMARIEALDRDLRCESERRVDEQDALHRKIGETRQEFFSAIATCTTESNEKLEAAGEDFQKQLEVQNEESLARGLKSEKDTRNSLEKLEGELKHLEESQKMLDSQHENMVEKLSALESDTSRSVDQVANRVEQVQASADVSGLRSEVRQLQEKTAAANHALQQNCDERDAERQRVLQELSDEQRNFSDTIGARLDDCREEFKLPLARIVALEHALQARIKDDREKSALSQVDITERLRSLEQGIEGLRADILAQAAADISALDCEVKKLRDETVTAHRALQQDCGERDAERQRVLQELSDEQRHVSETMGACLDDSKLAVARIVELEHALQAQTKADRESSALSQVDITERLRSLEQGIEGLRADILAQAAADIAALDCEVKKLRDETVAAHRALQQDCGERDAERQRVLQELSDEQRNVSETMVARLNDSKLAIARIVELEHALQAQTKDDRENSALSQVDDIMERVRSLEQDIEGLRAEILTLSTADNCELDNSLTELREQAMEAERARRQHDEQRENDRRDFSEMLVAHSVESGNKSEVAMDRMLSTVEAKLKDQNIARCEVGEEIERIDRLVQELRQADPTVQSSADVAALNEKVRGLSEQAVTLERALEGDIQHRNEEHQCVVRQLHSERRESERVLEEAMEIRDKAVELRLSQHTENNLVFQVETKRQLEMLESSTGNFQTACSTSTDSDIVPLRDQLKELQKERCQDAEHASKRDVENVRDEHDRVLRQLDDTRRDLSDVIIARFAECSKQTEDLIEKVSMYEMQLPARVEQVAEAFVAGEVERVSRLEQDRLEGRASHPQEVVSAREMAATDIAALRGQLCELEESTAQTNMDLRRFIHEQACEQESVRRQKDDADVGALRALFSEDLEGERHLRKESLEDEARAREELQLHVIRLTNVVEAERTHRDDELRRSAAGVSALGSQLRHLIEEEGLQRNAAVVKERELCEAAIQELTCRLDEDCSLRDILLGRERNSREEAVASFAQKLAEFDARNTMQENVQEKALQDDRTCEQDIQRKFASEISQRFEAVLQSERLVQDSHDAIEACMTKVELLEEGCRASKDAARADAEFVSRLRDSAVEGLADELQEERLDLENGIRGELANLKGILEEEAQSTLECSPQLQHLAMRQAACEMSLRELGCLEEAHVKTEEQHATLAFRLKNDNENVANEMRSLREVVALGEASAERRLCDELQLHAEAVNEAHVLQEEAQAKLRRVLTEELCSHTEAYNEIMFKHAAIEQGCRTLNGNSETALNEVCSLRGEMLHELRSLSSSCEVQEAQKDSMREEIDRRIATASVELSAQIGVQLSSIQNGTIGDVVADIESLRVSMFELKSECKTLQQRSETAAETSRRVDALSGFQDPVDAGRVHELDRLRKELHSKFSRGLERERQQRSVAVEQLKQLIGNTRASSAATSTAPPPACAQSTSGDPLVEKPFAERVPCAPSLSDRNRTARSVDSGRPRLQIPHTEPASGHRQSQGNIPLLPRKHGGLMPPAPPSIPAPDGPPVLPELPELP
eukprot:TRINITY_DN29247_c0_g1_i2.p1 TRINITY_DN29247_c0_g1~~TRINITY_DN29247_c0_g1_i2.p1  ORF type:complete len:1671 (+),score=387.69 TRINITY_DN29247_c0_g1_i2:104-5116(+)